MRTITAIVNDQKINLKLRDSITVICGDSATGKTYLFETLKDAENTELRRDAHETNLGRRDLGPGDRWYFARLQELLV